VYINDRLVARMEGDGEGEGAVHPGSRRVLKLNGRKAEIWLPHGHYTLRLTSEGCADHIEVIEVTSRTAKPHTYHTHGRPRKLTG